MSALTNRDKPFEPGEVISFAGDQFIVVTNYGDSGRVRERGDDGAPWVTFSFFWTFQGEDCVRVQP